MTGRGADTTEPLRAAIVGCGQIAGAHLAALHRIAPDRSRRPPSPGAAVVCAVADRDPGRARRLAEQAGGATPYTDLGSLLARERPDVVHVVSPPATHAALATEAMGAGCHVLVEKPMALSRTEATRMVAVAEERGVVLSTCHNYLLKPSVLRARRLVDEGAIGRVLGVTAYYGVSGEGAYTPTSPGRHWAWRLPGGIFTNFLPHLIYLVEAFVGPTEGIDGVALSPDRVGVPATELVALLRGRESTATLQISLCTRPYAKFLEVRGEAGTVRADLVREVCTVQPDRELPGAVDKVAHTLAEIVQLTAGTVNSVVRVTTGQWRSMPGLHALIRDLYRAIATGGRAPVAAAEGQRVVEVLERIWARMPPDGGGVPAGSPQTTRPAAPGPGTTAEGRAHPALADQRVTVTGATGFLGARLVGALARCGAEVTALVRDPGSVPFQVERQAKLVTGTLDDRQALQRAMAGARVVYHCAAVTTNRAAWSLHRATNIEGTRAVLEAARAVGVGRLVHVSSVAVHGVTGRGVVDDGAPCTDEGDPWAHYPRSKLAAERLVLGEFRDHGLPVAVVRLGLLYGPGRPARPALLRSGRVAVTVGRGTNHLPYTHVDDAVEALLLAGVAPDVDGDVLTVVGEPQMRVRQALRLAHPELRLITVPVPVGLLGLVAGALERRQRARGSQVPPRLSRYVVRSACRDLRYDTSRTRHVLGWRPAVDPADGLRAAAGGWPGAGRNGGGRHDST